MRLARTTALAALLVVALGATAADVNLNAIQYPEKTSIDVPFTSTERAPAGASLEAEIRAEGAQTRVEMSWKKMAPAILFGGDVTSYAAWVVTKDGVAENLGELFVNSASGSATFSTGKKVFGLMVTAEPFPGVTRPTDLVLFTNGPANPKKAKNEAFTFGKFMSEARPANASIATIPWKSGEPLELAQAKAVLATAEKVKAGDVNAKAMAEAKIAFTQAENSSRGGSSKAVTDYSRRATALAAEAIRDTYRKRAADEAARIEAEQKAKEAALTRSAMSEAEKRRETETALAQLEELRQKTELDLQQTKQAAAALAAAKAQLEAEKAALQKERDALAARLGGALEKVASTTKTARGMVVNLEGISFDTGKATLKPDTRVTVGKLAGILLMIPDLNIRIEGYTDSTGQAATNMKLSAERAKNVFGLLREQGIDEARMAYEGYGAENPIAANDTAEGRAKNRRVEIIVAEGQIQAAPKAAPAAAPAPAPKK
jgi:outer membrane protein OmpA-like peptidoglycan-associated protein